MEEDPYKSPETDIESEDVFVPLRRRLRSWLWSFALWFNTVMGGVLIFQVYKGTWGSILSIMLSMNICFILGMVLLNGSDQVDEDSKRRR